MGYRVVEDLKSDVMFEADGKDLKELFENAAKGLFSIICEMDKVEPKRMVEIEVHGENLQDLMYNWLQKLIEVVDTEELFLSNFDIYEASESHLKARCFGEEITPEKSGIVVKAVTYYNFSVERTKNGFRMTAVVDI